MVRAECFIPGLYHNSHSHPFIAGHLGCFKFSGCKLLKWAILFSSFRCFPPDKGWGYLLKILNIFLALDSCTLAQDRSSHPLLPNSPQPYSAILKAGPTPNTAPPALLSSSPSPAGLCPDIWLLISAQPGSFSRWSSSCLLPTQAGARRRSAQSS